MREQNSWWRRMGARYISWSPWLAGIFAAAFAGFLAARISDGVKQFLKDPATIGWISAAATFSAAVVALRIANHADQTNRAREAQRGQLVAAVTRSKIPVIGDLLAKAESALSDSNLMAVDRVKAAVPMLQKSIDVVLAVDHAKIYAYNPHLAAELVNIADMLSICVYSATKEDADLQGLQEILRNAVIGLRARNRRIDALTQSARGEAIDPWLEQLNQDGSVAGPVEPSGERSSPGRKA